MANDGNPLRPRSPLSLLWDEAILDVLENGTSVKNACVARGLSKGSYYYELERRNMHTRTPRAKKEPESKVARKQPKRAAMKKPQEWDSIYAQYKKGHKTMQELCAEHDVSIGAFKAAIDRRAKKVTKAVLTPPAKAPMARPVPMLTVPTSPSAEVERLRAQVHELIGENKAYRVMLKMPARRRR